MQSFGPRIEEEDRQCLAGEEGARRGGRASLEDRHPTTCDRLTARARRPGAPLASFAAHGAVRTHLSSFPAMEAIDQRRKRPSGPGLDIQRGSRKGLWRTHRGRQLRARPHCGGRNERQSNRQRRRPKRRPGVQPKQEGGLWFSKWRRPGSIHVSVGSCNLICEFCRTAAPKMIRGQLVMSN